MPLFLLPLSFLIRNNLHGIFRIPEAIRVFFELERSPDNQEYVINSASLKKMECDPNKLSLNGNLEEADGQTKYWDVWGGDTSITTVTPGFGGSGYAIKSFARPHYSHGQAQILNMDCVLNGKS